MSMALGISPLCPPTKVQSWRWAAARREGGIAQLGALDGHSHSAGPSHDPMQRCWWHHDSMLVPLNLKKTVENKRSSKTDFFRDVGGDPCTVSTHHLWQGRCEVIVIDPQYCIGGWQARDLLGVFPPNISFLELTILLQFSGNVDPPQLGNLGLLTHGFPLCPAIWKSKTGCLRYVKKGFEVFLLYPQLLKHWYAKCIYIYICMCVYIYIRIYICMCTYIHTYIHTCIALHCIALHCIALHCIALHCIALHYITLHTYIYIYICIHIMYMYMYMYMYLYIYIYIHIYLYICIYVYTYTYVHMCVYVGNDIYI